MSDEKMPDHETLERVFKSEPERLLAALPDCIASRRAKQLVETVYDYAREAREQAPR